MKNIVGKMAGVLAIAALAFAVPGFAQGMNHTMSPQSQQQSQQTQQQQGQTQQGQQGQQGQQTQGQQGQQGAQGTTTTATAPPPVDPKEEAAYKEFHDLPNTDAKGVVNSGEDFVKNYPNSRYDGSVYSRLTTAYMQIGDDQKMFAAGNKALAIIPDNVDVLPVMAMAYSRRIDPGAIDANDKMRMVETYANSGILLLNQLQKPASITDDTWDKSRNAKLAMCHSGLGLIDYDRQKYTEAVQQFSEAIKLENDPDPVDQYLLGMSFESAKDFPNAISSLEACAKDTTSMQAVCKKALDDAKKKAAAQPKQ